MPENSKYNKYLGFYEEVMNQTSNLHPASCSIQIACRLCFFVAIYFHPQGQLSITVWFLFRAVFRLRALFVFEHFF